MRILLDTKIFLWCILDDPKLTKEARKLISNADAIFVSSASIWEIAIKKNLGKIDTNNDLGELSAAIEASGFLELPITAQHAAKVSSLKQIHKDPFDHILIAQAISEPLIFVTSDKLLTPYSHLVLVV